MMTSEAYKVKIDAFEGPLDLLLHLIKQYEIDIYDIPVADITQQYIDYIHAMKSLELNIASEYLVMSATLLSIKSQMLLPKQPVDEDVDEYEQDPRDELIERLIAYKKYKEAAQGLEMKETEFVQTFTRPPIIFKELEDKVPVERGDSSVYDMVRAFNKMIERKKWSEPLDTRVTRTEIPMEERMAQLKERVEGSVDGIAFEHLFTYDSKSHIVITFIALLELMKSNEVYCRQDNNYDSLYIYLQN